MQVCVLQEHRALSGAAQSGDVNMGCESCMILLSPKLLNVHFDRAPHRVGGPLLMNQCEDL